MSEEGRLLIWNIDDKLAYPVIGFNLKFKIGKSVFSLNPTAFTYNHNEAFNFLVGTLDGNVYRCAFNKPVDDNYDHLFQKSKGVVWRSAVKKLISNMNDKEIIETKNYMEKFCIDKNVVDLNPDIFYKLKPDVNKMYKNCLKSNYEKHISIVTSIEYNPFIRNLFLTCSFDGSLRVYHTGSKYIMSNNLTNDYYTTSIWSYFKPNLIMGGTSNGKIEFLKIANKSLRLLHSIERKFENSLISYPINKIKNNPINKNILAFTFEDGILDIVKLSDGLCNDKYDDIDKLYKILNNISL